MPIAVTFRKHHKLLAIMKPPTVLVKARCLFRYRSPMLQLLSRTCRAGNSSSSSLPYSTGAKASTSPFERSLFQYKDYLKRELARFDPDVPIELASTPPASWFTDPAFHTLEMASIFSDNPLCVGSTLQIPLPGDYFCGQVGSHPFIVLREASGNVKAFYNVCRHKGMRLVAEDAGRVGQTVLTCPYHGWEYRLDGRLAKATRVAGIRDFAPKDYGLLEIPLWTWGPLVFLRFGQAENEAPHVVGKDGSHPLAYLEPLLERLDAEHGFSSGLRHVRRRRYRVQVGFCGLIPYCTVLSTYLSSTLVQFRPCRAPSLTSLPSHPPSPSSRSLFRPPSTPQCNHKVVSDNYLDNGYHVPYAHKALGNALDLSSYGASVHDRYSVQACRGAPSTSSPSFPPSTSAFSSSSPFPPRISPNHGGGSATRLGKAALYAHIYPGLMLNRYGPWMDLNILFPVSSSSCDLIFDYFLEETFIAEKLEKDGEAGLRTYVEESLIASDEVQREDTYLCENVQAGLESGGYDRGRYAPRVEFLDHVFHQWLAQDLRAAVGKIQGREGTHRPRWGKRGRML